jgi:hypothetical protein
MYCGSVQIKKEGKGEREREMLPVTKLRIYKPPATKSRTYKDKKPITKIQCIQRQEKRYFLFRDSRRFII